MNIRSALVRGYWILSVQFGLDLRAMFRSLVSLPRYFQDLLKFRIHYKGRIELVPCLHDWYEEGGATKDEYFWQDLFVARLIFSASPKKHVDVGSRVDGFVAHVACFRDIEVLDIRPITSRVPGVQFKRVDLMCLDGAMKGYCDSLSCLHALEHFGLGRYGDDIDSNGYELGIGNMSSILCSGGLFYLSLPVGIERVEFNANRVFDPRTIVEVASRYCLELRSFSLFTCNDGLLEIEISDQALEDVSKMRYGLGIFTFMKA